MSKQSKNSLQPTISGYEEPGRGFSFERLRIPPDSALPDALHELTAELAEQHTRWRDAAERHRELSHKDSARAAQQADTVLAGKAARNGEPDPGPVNVDALAEGIEAARKEMASAEGAGQLIVQELDGELRTAAEEGLADALAQIETAQEDHARALAELKTARKAVVDGARFFDYWRNVLRGGNVQWRGRTDGRGVDISIGERKIALEDFATMAGAITKEASAIASAVDACTARDDNDDQDNA